MCFFCGLVGFELDLPEFGWVSWVSFVRFGFSLTVWLYLLWVVYYFGWVLVVFWVCCCVCVLLVCGFDLGFWVFVAWFLLMRFDVCGVLGVLVNGV